MIRRLIMGILISSLVVVLPVLGNREILLAPQIWILVLFAILASLFQPSYNPFTITVKSGDRGTGAQIIWSIYATQFAALLETAYLRYPVSVQWDIITTIALASMTLGLLLRTWAVFTLGNLFTMHLAVQRDHAIIRKGPFGIVRHPSYLGAFILYMATTIFLHAWFSMAAVIVILPCAFLRRIYYEEKLLKEEFGEQYESYRSEVKGILPRIW